MTPTVRAQRPEGTCEAVKLGLQRALPTISTVKTSKGRRLDTPAHDIVDMALGNALGGIVMQRIFVNVWYMHGKGWRKERMVAALNVEG